MVFGYIRSGVSVSVSDGVNVPMEKILDAKYRPYVKVLDDDAAGMITVCFETGKQSFPYDDNGPMISRRGNAIKAFLDAVAKKSEKDRIVFRGLTTLGTISEAKELYFYMLERKVNAEFFSTPVANIKRYFEIMEKLPYTAQVMALEGFEFSYERESFLMRNGWVDPLPE